MTGYRHKREKPAGPRQRMLLIIAARIVARSPDADIWQSFGGDARPAIVELLRDLAEGKRDPEVVLGRKMRTGRPSKTAEHVELALEYWRIRNQQPSSRSPHKDACKALRSKHPEWRRYTDETIARYVRRLGPQYRDPSYAEILAAFSPVTD